MDRNLLDGDVARLVAAIEDGRRDDTAAPMPWALLDGLQRVIPCDLDVTFQWHEPGRRTTRVIQGVGQDGAREVVPPFVAGPDEPFWQLWPASMCSWPQRSGNLRAVIHTGDFLPTDRQRRADPMLRYLDVSYSMIVSLPAPAREVRRVIFMRSAGPAFTERDRQLATLLRPHLQELWLAVEARRRGLSRLSPREREILELAAAGMSYADIAAALFLSVGTVRKHMEHVRERLGVHSARAAAAIAVPEISALPTPLQPQPADGDRLLERGA